MTFPFTRMRRLRASENIRSLFRETHIDPRALVLSHTLRDPGDTAAQRLRVQAGHAAAAGITTLCVRLGPGDAALSLDDARQLRQTLAGQSESHPSMDLFLDLSPAGIRAEQSFLQVLLEEEPFAARGIGLSANSPLLDTYRSTAERTGRIELLLFSVLRPFSPGSSSFGRSREEIIAAARSERISGVDFFLIESVGATLDIVSTLRNDLRLPVGVLSSESESIAMASLRDDPRILSDLEFEMATAVFRAQADFFATPAAVVVAEAVRRRSTERPALS